ncbi:MAG: hypothetical protein ACE5EK_04215 [Nitrospinales bacterium]
MAEIALEEDKLRELISEEVKKTLALTFQDVDEVRKSPAGGIIRLEEEVKGIRKEIGVIRNEIEVIKSTMATKTTLNYLIALNIAMLGLIGSLVVKFLFLM